MLIIDGTDLTGKTTIAKAIVGRDWFELQGYMYKHFPPVPQAFDPIWGYVSNAVQCSVQDRFHLSEIVYGTVVRSRPIIDPEQYRIVDGYLRSLGAMTIVVTASDELLEARYDARADEEIFSLDQILEVNETFLEISQEQEWRGYKPDFDHHVHLCDDHPLMGDDFITALTGKYVVRQTEIRRARERMHHWMAP